MENDEVPPTYTLDWHRDEREPRIIVVEVKDAAGNTVARVPFSEEMFHRIVR